jgi:hypothetical protein
MKRILAAAFLMAPTFAMPAFAESPHQEMEQHPRIRKAVHEMEDAVAYMEAAPHDFGGHKADAIRKTREAIEQLKLAMAYRAAVDSAHGR